MSSSLQALEDQYTLLTQNLAASLAACSAQEQRDTIQTQYVTARSNYWSCVDKTFQDGDPATAALVAQMKAEQDSLKKALEQLQDIGKVIKIITAAVNTGTELAGLAA
jgi:hypothetical protein